MVNNATHASSKKYHPINGQQKKPHSNCVARNNEPINYLNNSTANGEEQFQMQLRIPWKLLYLWCARQSVKHISLKREKL